MFSLSKPCVKRGSLDRWWEMQERCLKVLSCHMLSCKQVLSRSSQSRLLAQILQVCTRITLGSISQHLHSSGAILVTPAYMKHMSLPGIAGPTGSFTLLRGHIYYIEHITARRVQFEAFQACHTCRLTLESRGMALV